MNVVLAHPEGYGLIPEVVDLARRNSAKSGGSFAVATSMEEAFRDADVVYPKSWAPFDVMQRRTPLLKEGDREGSRRSRRSAWPTTPGSRPGNATRRR
jgi:ornithine carbamoyltransferase